MSSQGWVSIHRKIQDSWLWEEKPFDKARAFIDLILLVNHEDKEILVDGEIKTIKRGQRLTSISKLSKRWGWNSRTVKRFLVLLEQDQKITLDITPRKHTMITLKNYQKYQGEKSESTSPSTQESTSQSASRGIHGVHINNNDNNDNNDNKMIVAELKQAFKASTGRYPIINHPINLTNHNQILKAISKIKDSQYLQKSIQWDWMLDNLDKIIAGEYDDYKKKKYYKPQSKRDKPNNDEILILRKMYHDLGLSEQEIEEAIRREE